MFKKGTCYVLSEESNIPFYFWSNWYKNSETLNDILFIFTYFLGPKSWFSIPNCLLHTTFKAFVKKVFFWDTYVTRLVNDRYNTACCAQEGNLTFHVILISETILPNLLQLLGQLPRHPRTPGRSWRQKPHGNIASCHRSVASISGNMLLVRDHKSNSQLTLVTIH